jgi:chromosome partitioning protein
VKVLASYSIKGGVGKTTAATNLAWLAAAGGARVLLWDLDPQGAATFLFRVRPKVKGGARALVGRKDLIDVVKASDYENLDVLPADFSFRNLDLWLDAQKKPTRQLSLLLEGMRDEYDLVLMDCAPSVSLVSENIVRSADLLLAPVVPSPLSVRTLDQLEEFVTDTKGPTPAIFAFLSMVDRRRTLHRDLIRDFPQRLIEKGRIDVAKTVIPTAAAVEQMGMRRAPVVEWAPQSTAGRAYAELWSEVLTRLG